MKSVVVFQSASEHFSEDKKYYLSSFLGFFDEEGVSLGFAHGTKVRAVDAPFAFSFPILKTPSSFGTFSLLLSPFLLLQYFLILFFLRVFRGVRYALCLSVADKIFIPPLAKLFGIKVFWLETDPFSSLPLPPHLGFLLRFSSRFSHTLLSSSAGQKYFQHAFPSASTFVFPHSIGNHVRESASFSLDPTKSFILSFIGTLDKESGLAIALRSIADVKTVMPHVRFVIVGDGSERGALEWLSRKLLLQDSVRFVGNQPDIEQWYRNIHLVLLPNTHETPTQFSITHALAARTPVICTDISESREMSERYENIFLVPKGSSEKLSEMIFSIYHDYEHAFTKAMQVQERIFDERSKDRLHEQFLSLL